MPTKTEKSIAAAAALPLIPKELIDQFCSGPMTGEAVNAATTAFKRALIERALGGELCFVANRAVGEVPVDTQTQLSPQVFELLLVFSGECLAQFDEVSARDWDLVCRLAAGPFAAL